MKNKLLIVVFCLICCFGLVSSLGCCVNNGFDRCYSGTQEDACSDMGGNFYPEDASCGSIKSCDMGCCIVGLDASMMTRGKCQTETRASGFSAMNFMQTNEDCSKYVTSQDWGACLTRDSFGEKTCFYLTRGQCVGEFKPGVLCSSVGNVVCNKTNNSICYNNNAYYIDSCGNRDSLKATCDYNIGTVCKQTDSSSSSSAICSSVDCVDSFDFNRFVVNSSYIKKPVYNGPITRKQGDVWCVTNGMVPYEDKYIKNNTIAVNKSVIDIVFESIFGAIGLGGIGSGYNHSAESLVGNRFFSRYCINGEIATEPCDDVKGGYCNGASSWYNNESTGNGGQCDTNEWRRCLSAESEEDCDEVYCDWYDPKDFISTTSQKMIEELYLGKCLPKFPGGIADDNSKESICSQGNYQTTFSFWFINPGDNAVAYLKTPFNSTYGNAGFLLESAANWYTYMPGQLTINPTSGTNVYAAQNGIIVSFFYGSFDYLPLNPDVIEYLDYRCSRIADCSGKMNWVGKNGSKVENGLTYKSVMEVNTDLAMVSSTSSSVSKYSFSEDKEIPVIYFDSSQSLIAATSEPTGPITVPLKYECKPYKTPKNGSCEMCESDSTACTKYKCEALGANCEYYDISNGVKGGSCMNRTDFSAPKITMSCPSSSSIKPQEPIKISVTTSEVSQCRFSIGDAKASYDLMSYDLGATWGTSHDTVLTVPGMNKIKNGNITQYPLLTTSGEFNVYVRCVDPAGNGDTTPAELCAFNVPKTPDKNQPVILKVDPISGSAAAFNSSIKNIKLLVNEPVECRWDSLDKEYSLMSNSFDCINKLVLGEDISGYECYGGLAVNFTNKTAGSQKSYYIRCRDQPGLNETGIYTRNTNYQSLVYNLKASDKLEILDMGNKTRLTLGYGIANWTLSVRTKGGGYSGESVCKWRLSFQNTTTSFSEFMNTGGTVHTQTMTNVAEGDYLLSIKCTDKAGNVANVSAPLEIRYDINEPIITRVFNNNGNVKISTIEPAACKFTNSVKISVGCSFPFSDSNLTLMTGATNLEHSTSMKKGVNYYIKCQDFYGNENSYCGMIAKFV